MGFENPNKDIMIHKYRVDLLKNKVDNYINVIKELDSLDIDNMSEEDKEFFKKIKEELVRDYYKRHFIQWGVKFYNGREFKGNWGFKRYYWFFI